MATSQLEDRQRVEAALFDRARVNPSKVAVVDGTESHTYADLADRVERTAVRLADVGVSPGDRVATYLDKTVESVIALYAAWTAGAIAVPINESLRSRQVRHILDDSGSRVVISSPRKLGRVPADTFHGVRTMGVEPPARGTYGQRRFQPARAGGAAPSTILYTSGSTGRAKGILISHANLIAGARIVSRYLEISPDERILSILPFSFDYGLNQLLDAVRAGATLYLQRSHFAPDICRSLEQHAITLMAAVPPLWIQLMERPSPFPKMEFPRLRTLTSSGGVFPSELVARYRAQVPHARLFLMYGLSEAFRSTYLPPDLIQQKPGSIGRAIPETEIYVLSEDGRECTGGQPGELVHSGPTVALGYWQNPEASAARFRPHPFAPESGEIVVFSGDIVKRDEEGFLYFVGRRDQMIKTMGYRVSPEEVEELLYASGLLSEAVAHGRADTEAGAVVVAHVVPRSPAAFRQEQLLAFCRREMPSYMVPREIVVHETLPRTASGKIDRQAVLT